MAGFFFSSSLLVWGIKISQFFTIFFLLFTDMFRSDAEKGASSSNTCCKNDWCYCEVKKKSRSIIQSLTYFERHHELFFLYEKSFSLHQILIKFFLSLQNHFSSCIRCFPDNFLCTQKVLCQWLMLFPKLF